MKIIPNGQFMSRERIKAGLSMRELGRQAGINISTVSQIECNNKPVSPKTAKSICIVLGKDFDDLFTIQTKEDIA